jgi:5-methyltetrahydrofolate--homocysteine methyltransferase
VGEASRDLFKNAQGLLKVLVSEKQLTAKAVWGFYPANRDGDDIVVYGDEGRTTELARIPTLRQQKERPSDAEHQASYTALADFIAPVGTPDWIGMFAITAGHGVTERAAAFEAAHDDFNAILVKALADRLAEAGAEWLHREARARGTPPTRRSGSTIWCASATAASARRPATRRARTTPTSRRSSASSTQAARASP